MLLISRFYLNNLVGARGFEPPAPCSQSRCATRLRYAPTFFWPSYHCLCEGASAVTLSCNVRSLRYTVNGNNLRFLTLTPTLSHRERELKEVAINGRSKYIFNACHQFLH